MRELRMAERGMRCRATATALCRLNIQGKVILEAAKLAERESIYVRAYSAARKTGGDLKQAIHLTWPKAATSCQLVHFPLPPVSIPVPLPLPPAPTRSATDPPAMYSMTIHSLVFCTDEP